MTPRLILASSSPYRRELLDRLRLKFEVIVPEVDESPLPDESPGELVTRLAEAKARSAGLGLEHSLVIGADQVAVLDGRMVGKPHGRADAVGQLQAASGRVVALYTGLALLNVDSGRVRSAVVPFRVEFRTLDTGIIQRYLEIEQPYDCCGSVKAEGLGIALLRRLEGEDPNALIGLPLIRLVELLGAEGFQVLE